jgi:hypothetical protein
MLDVAYGPLWTAVIFQQPPPAAVMVHFWLLLLSQSQRVSFCAVGGADAGHVHHAQGNVGEFILAIADVGDVPFLAVEAANSPHERRAVCGGGHVHDLVAETATMGEGRPDGGPVSFHRPMSPRCRRPASPLLAVMLNR